MKRKTQTGIASCFLACSVGLTGVVLYLVKLFPRTVAVWADQGKQLSATEQFMVQVSNLAKLLGLPILGFLVLLIAASAMWLVASIGGRQGESASRA